jgi:hypothetical protein
MRRSKTAAEVGFTARIPQGHKRSITGLLPMTGGKRWFMEAALEEFIELCRNDPTRITWVNDQILQMKEDGRPQEKLEEFLPRVKTDLYTAFNDLFPQKGATTWFIRTLVARFIQDMQEQASFEESVRESVRSMIMSGARTPVRNISFRNVVALASED